MKRHPHQVTVSKSFVSRGRRALASGALVVLRRQRWLQVVQLLAMLLWTFYAPLSQATYVPDAGGNPVWDGNGTEYAEGPDYGNNDYDTLPNWYEDYLGTSRYNPDTDNDNISDSDELFVTQTNPLDADSNDNGWSDYEDFTGASAATADPDNDGVTN